MGQHLISNLSVSTVGADMSNVRETDVEMNNTAAATKVANNSANNEGTTPVELHGYDSVDGVVVVRGNTIDCD